VGLFIFPYVILIGMSLNSAFESYKISKSQSKCSIGALIDNMPKEDQEALKKAILEKIPPIAIYRILKSENYRLSKDGLYYHLKGQCKCQ
jgi:hypothetical protein